MAERLTVRLAVDDAYFQDNDNHHRMIRISCTDNVCPCWISTWHVHNGLKIRIRFSRRDIDLIQTAISLNITRADKVLSTQFWVPHLSGWLLLLVCRQASLSPDSNALRVCHRYHAQHKRYRDAHTHTQIYTTPYKCITRLNDRKVTILNVGDLCECVNRL